MSDAIWQKNIYNINDFYDRIINYINNHIDHTVEKTNVDKNWYENIKKLCNTLREYQKNRFTILHFHHEISGSKKNKMFRGYNITWMPPLDNTKA